jgi:hypothetical protein
MDNFEKYLAEKKNRGSSEEYYEKVEEEQSLAVKVMTMIISWMTFLLAASLSWECNSRCTPNMMQTEKLVRALIAGWFGFLYIILYFIFWSGNCNKVREGMTTTATKV